MIVSCLNVEQTDVSTEDCRLGIGDRLLYQMEVNNERRIQRTYQQLVEAERQRLEKEYRLKTEELNRHWQALLDEERRRLQKVTSSNRV